MKILTWNIKHGGSNGVIPKILLSILEHDPDIAVLTEYRVENGRLISESLRDKGWLYQLSSDPPPKTNGILIASRRDITKSPIDYGLPEASHRWLDVTLKDIDLRVLGIHIPGAGDKWGKEDFWKAVVDFGKSKEGEKVLMIGDFNTGLDIDAEGTPFRFSEYTKRLNDSGWIDAWRFKNKTLREYTWYSKSGNGFRLDYAYLSPALKKGFVNAYYSHEERILKLSDHSSLCVELNQLARSPHPTPSPSPPSPLPSP